MKKLLLVGVMTLSSLLISNSYGAELDLSKSAVSWQGTKVTGKHFGHIGIKTAEVKTQKSKLTSGEIVLDINDLSVSDLSGEWKTKFLGHIKSADFFDVKKHPTAKIKVNKISGTNAEGLLTIKGITHPVKFQIIQDGKTYSGNVKFDRTKFKMVYGSGNFFKNLGDKTIHDEVNVSFRLVLK